MKLYYVWLYALKNGSGVHKKIFSQIKALKDASVDATLLLVEDLGKTPSPSSATGKEPVNTGGVNNLLVRLFNSRKIANGLGNRIRQCKSSDILLIRYPFLITSCPVVFLRPLRKCKVIFDYNAIESREFLLEHNYFYFLLEYFFGMFIRYQADGGICVTNEIADYQKKKIGSRRTAFTTIGNGFEVHSVNLRTPPSFNERELSVLCLANVQRWHGIDRIIAGISSYSGPLSIKLHIAGDGAEIPNLKRMVEERGLATKVIFYGFVTGPALDDLFDQCHIAAGSLGIHRKGLQQTAELKIREYCSRGIPFILACSDPDIPEDFPYMHTIPADETPVSIEDFFHFTTSVYRCQDHPREMQEYATRHLDWSVKMKQLKQFLEREMKG